MRNKTKLTLLSQCIFISLASFSGSALADTCAGNDISQTCGLTPYTDGNYYQDSGVTNAVIANETTPHADVFMDGHRGDNDTQSLVVNQSDMTGYYIEGSNGGTANITLENGSSADMIEVGTVGATTNTTVTVDNSTLNGENSSVAYDNNGDGGPTAGDKDYMHGAAIYLDPQDAGAHNVNIINGSHINGSIISAGQGEQNIAVSGDSTISSAGIYAGSAKSATTISLTNSSLDAEGSEIAEMLPQYNADASTGDGKGFDDIGIAAYSTNTLNLNINNSDITGDIALLNNNSKTAAATNVNITNGSTVNGDITLKGNADSTIYVDNSTVNGDINTGAGNDTITLANNSQVNGNINGGTKGTDTLNLDESSTINGEISNINTVNTAGNNDITTDKVDNDTTWNIDNGSTLTADTTGNDVQVNMSTDSQAELGNVDASAGDTLVVTSTALSTANQQNVEVATFTTASGTPTDAVTATFANGSQQVESRSGAYNYEDTLTEQQVAAAGLQDTTGTAYNVLFSSSRGELASDVQGMIAGLDAAKQAGRMITDDLANRLNQVHLQNLFGHGVDGAQVWGDFLYQNGDYSDDVDYKDITQGVQGGVDWTSHLNNGDSLTGGIALGWTRSRDRSTNGGSNNFNDSVYGNYYSVYGGWQQSLHDNLWGMFVDGSFSYGDMRYSTSANNVSNATTGMTQALDGSSDGNLYTTQARAGVNIVLPGETVLQPYATLGWDKAQEDGFSDQAITFGDSQVSEWNTGIGMRVTTKLADLNKNVELYPWLDARYQTEFSDNTDIKAADYHNTDGHNATMGIFGAGINTTIGKDFSLNTGVYFGTGDVDNDASVQAGVSYHF
ncbi:autotransporter domain-containing protein [Kluyvera georgiana]|mgnify:CR=1 FL=1|uniref:autotransporter domain-containing protein n=1 Tax=Kluyvera georgiana TaxID=73098 RepID=UPI0008070508|nr:autotransporter domain-containing protein [Kluyvera georgiana]